MALSTREVLLLIRAKEDASRALSGISRTLRTTGAAAEAAAARSRAAALRAQAESMRTTGATRAQIEAVRLAARAYDEQARSIDAARRRMQAYRDVIRSAGEGLTAVGIGLGAAGVGGLFMAKSWIDTAVEYERQVRLTRTQVDKMRFSFEQLHGVGIRVAKDLPIQFEQIQPALFDIFSSMEVGLEDAERLLRAFSKGAVAGQTDIQSVSRATIGLLNAFKLPASDVNRILDLQFELVQEGIGTYEEWNQRIGLVTPSAVRAGQSIEMMVAALASSTRMGISAARSGTAVARAFDAMSNPKVVQRLEKMGVDIVDATGKFRPFNEVLGQFREKLMKLPEKDRVAMILDVFKGAGSTIEARRFLQNILLGAGNLEIFNNILKETAGSAGNMERAYTEMAGGTAAQTERLRNSWKILQEALGRALLPAFNDLLGGLRAVLDWFGRLPAGTQAAIGKIVAFGSVLAIAGGALLAIVGSIAIFATAIAGIAGPVAITIGVLAGLALGIGAVGLAFFRAWQDSQNFRALVRDIGENLAEAKVIITDSFDQIKSAWDEHLKPALGDLKEVINSDVIPAINEFESQVWDDLKPKLEETARVVEDIAESSMKILAAVIRSQVIPAIKDLTKMYRDNKDTIGPLIGVVGQMVKFFAILAAMAGFTVVTSFTIMMLTIRSTIALFQILISWTQRVIGWIKDLWHWITNLGGASRSMVGAVSASFRAAASIISSFRGAVIGFFSGAGGWLFAAGRNIIGGLVRGIQSAAGALRAALGAVTAAIPSWKGPRERDLRLLRPAGKHIMTGLVAGIRDEVPHLRRMLEDVTAVMSPRGLDFAGAGNLGRVGSGGGQTSVFNNEANRTVTINNTVYTNDKDPRTIAAELGWEIANRVG